MMRSGGRHGMGVTLLVVMAIGGSVRGAALKSGCVSLRNHASLSQCGD